MATGGTNKDQILNVARADIYLAAVGAVAPTDASTDPGSDWYNVGHTTEDGLNFSTTVNFEEFKSAQSRGRVVKRIQTSDDATVAVVLTQWNNRNLKAAFGGGTVTQVTAAVAGANGNPGTPGVYKFVPAKLGERAETAVIIDVTEGTKRYRFVFPRTLQTEGVSVDLNIGATSQLPLSLAVLAVDSADAFYILVSEASNGFAAA